jgi:hypothetical protein
LIRDRFFNPWRRLKPTSTRASGTYDSNPGDFKTKDWLCLAA